MSCFINGIDPEELPERPICPRCGRAGREFYYDRCGDCFGCDDCVSILPWDEVNND